MTTKDIIKILPLKEEIKTQILDNFDSMDPSKKFTIERIAWETYDMIFQKKLDENLELQLTEVREGKGEIGRDFYKHAVKKTEEQMGLVINKSVDNADLAAARKAMEVIIKEMKAAKMPLKYPNGQS